jgi:hypothetical protein
MCATSGPQYGLSMAFSALTFWSDGGRFTNTVRNAFLAEDKGHKGQRASLNMGPTPYSLARHRAYSQIRTDSRVVEDNQAARVVDPLQRAPNEPDPSRSMTRQKQKETHLDLKPSLFIFPFYKDSLDVASLRTVASALMQNSGQAPKGALP